MLIHHVLLPSTSFCQSQGPARPSAVTAMPQGGIPTTKPPQYFCTSSNQHLQVRGLPSHMLRHRGITMAEAMLRTSWMLYCCRCRVTPNTSAAGISNDKPWLAGFSTCFSLICRWITIPSTNTHYSSLATCQRDCPNYCFGQQEQPVCFSIIWDLRESDTVLFHSVEDNQ